MIGLIIAIMAFIICLLSLIIGYILMEDYTVEFYRAINLTIIPTITLPNAMTPGESNCIMMVAFPIFGTIAIDKIAEYTEEDTEEDKDNFYYEHD